MIRRIGGAGEGTMGVGREGAGDGKEGEVEEGGGRRLEGRYIPVAGKARMG